MGCGTSTEVKKSMQSQDRKIQRLMELNTDLTSKLQNAENLTAKQNTEISQLQEMITGRFNELENRLQETLVSRRSMEKTDFMPDGTIGSSDDNGVTGGVASSHRGTTDVNDIDLDLGAEGTTSERGKQPRVSLPDGNKFDPTRDPDIMAIASRYRKELERKRDEERKRTAGGIATSGTTGTTGSNVEV
mmetsp:Transcript_61101/g.69975  ORF Transcript_61101/g.69975 Transcript_61101/m.69975 type:complete len:189 (-) Transcript_61101:189-755(-)|eukprot:CAMPEP_0114996376 /NCGR_PEP_ID=MMETSP0216-20121206/14268_1 /TAXON_ID=223996 /ORGANISM="Protocruzia adherens, Strain Boccale" /LENGTH=188 /DNA_ID=CAMNT_0002360557 /DNA_START=334 /DNA_END=900 /DNA_ORIENTATION=+